MKLSELLSNIIATDFDIEIKGVTCAPRRSRSGYLFVCISRRIDGYMDNILKASAIIANFKIYSTTYIFHPNPQEIYTKIVSRFYRFINPKFIAAVTGTNGKTSVVEFSRQILQKIGFNTASFGTLGTYMNNVREEDSLTTPDTDELYSKLRVLNYRKIEHLVLEASSQGIDQYRIHGLNISTAAFTNLSQDHLDYHLNINSYLETKRRLFYEVLLKERAVVLNANMGKEYEKLLNIAKKRSNRIITYGRKSFSNVSSDITLLKQIPTQCGQHLVMRIKNKIYSTFFPVLGRFQACNLLCAIGIVISFGIDMQMICINKLVSPIGRMEKVKHFILVDYAHTPNALKKALLSLKWHFKKKIVLVFGCGGNRDKIKRAKMGKIAQIYADVVIVTDDNPRNEDPEEIRYDILTHCSSGIEIKNRKEAIEYGINIAYSNNMVLLVAGKGHEKFQIIGEKAFVFSDIEVIKNSCLK